MISFFLTLISFGIVAWGQPHFSSLLSTLSSSFGFALFWVALFKVERLEGRFLYAALWFFALQLVQLYWLASPTYQGTYIYFVYLGIALWLGIQFGLLSLFLPESGPIRLRHILGIGALWTLMEWGRLFILCGFAWNPVGLAFTGSLWTMQLAAVFGIFGLSFLLIVTNLLAVNALLEKKKRSVFIYVGVLAFPYLFGAIHVVYHEREQKGRELYRVALVQTALFPDQKQLYVGKEDKYVPPIFQWERIFKYLKDCCLKEFDLIVLPECAVPFGSHTSIYPLKEIEQILGKNFGHLDTLLKHPFAEKRNGEWFVSNAFLTQVLANHYGAEVVIGLDSKEEDHYYNAAFHFAPRREDLFRYEKRILLPLAETLPSSLFFLKPLVARYGVIEFFTPGKQGKVVWGKYPLSLSICYEECFPHLFREGRRRGAQVFVNVTNDAWYPKSTLPAQHFAHARVRAVENGTILLRACNTGVTAGIDSLGRTISCFQNSEGEFEHKAGVLVVICPLYSFFTLYTFWGNWLILTLSFACLIFLRKRILFLFSRIFSRQNI